jgi:hypothetical protein
MILETAREQWSATTEPEPESEPGVFVRREKAGLGLALGLGLGNRLYATALVQARHRFAATGIDS